MAIAQVEPARYTIRRPRVSTRSRTLDETVGSRTDQRCHTEVHVACLL